MYFDLKKPELSPEEKALSIATYYDLPFHYPRRVDINDDQYYS